MPADPALSPTAQITVEAWVKLRSMADSTSQDRVISKAGGYELVLSTSSSGCASGTLGQVQWRATIGGTDRRICGGQLSLGVWHHIAGTYNGARFIVYVDGVAVANVPRTGAIAAPAVPLYLGNRPELNRDLDGELDDVRIWSRALTQGQLYDNLSKPVNGSDPSLRAWYRFEQGNVQNLPSSAPNPINGVRGITGAAESSDPAWLSAP